MTDEHADLGTAARRPPLRILVVDDERSVRVTVRAFLEGAGYQTGQAEDADAAEALLASGGYDMVVSDIILPGASGLELLQRIRQNAPDVPVIMITGEPNAETAIEAVHAGATDYLNKPVTKEAILGAVAGAARRHGLDAPGD